MCSLEFSSLNMYIIFHQYNMCEINMFLQPPNVSRYVQRLCSPHRRSAFFSCLVRLDIFANDFHHWAYSGRPHWEFLQVSCFCTNNIPYFSSKVNDLNCSLIFFKHLVHFQQNYFVNFHIFLLKIFQKLQIGKRLFWPYFT